MKTTNTTNMMETMIMEEGRNEVPRANHGLEGRSPLVLTSTGRTEPVHVLSSLGTGIKSCLTTVGSQARTILQ